MREIKFRVWCKKTEEMHTVFKMGFSEDGLWYVEDEDKETEPPYFVGDDDWVLMQYVGLKDINGREIYEGDIIHHFEPNRDSSGGLTGYNDAYEVVKWNDVTGGFELLLDALIQPTVRGNVYENKDLLTD